VSLNATGTATGTVAVSGSGSDERTVTISSITGDGTLGITIAAGTASDFAGNLATASLPSATFTADNVAPVVSISNPSPTVTKSGPVTYTVNYTGADTVTLVAANVTLNTTGNATGTIAVTGSESATRTVTISGITGNGTLGITIAAGTASDNAGNTAPASTPSATFAVDNTAPIISIGAPSTTLTRGGPVSYTVTYSGADFVTLAAGDVSLNGTAAGTVSIDGAGNTTRTVTISSITGNGTLGITIAAGTASDTAGNTAPASMPSVTFEVDNTAPSISIALPSKTLTNSGPVSYAVTYAGADAITLATGNISLNATGSASGTVSVDGTGNTTRTVTISGITGTGTLGISIAAGTASDNAGNPAPASMPSATFVVDNTLPTSTISFPANGGRYNTALWDAGCNTPTSDVCGTKADTGSGIKNLWVSFRDAATNLYWSSGSNFDRSAEYLFRANGTEGWISEFPIGNFPTDGSYIIHSVAEDEAGNLEEGPTHTFIIDRSGPALTLTAPVHNTLIGSSTPSISGVGGMAPADLDPITIKIYAGTGTSGSSIQTLTATRGVGGAYSAVAGTLTDGTYTAQAEQSDVAENTSLSGANTFMIDTAAPTSGITFPAAGGNYNGAGWNGGCSSPGFCGTAAQTGAAPVETVAISIKNGSNKYWNGSAFSDTLVEVEATGTTAWSYGFDFSQFADGPYEVSVRATDTLGNSAVGMTRTFTIDGTEPETYIDEPWPANGSNMVSFYFSSDETGAAFECELDDEGFIPCLSPMFYGYYPDPVLSPGPHIFKVRALDPAGNEDATPEEFPWDAD
jgi:hypothetical protein